MNVALLIDGCSVAKWQADAVQRLNGRYKIHVYNCTNHKPARRRLRHFAYYALNLISIRSHRTRRTALPASMAIDRWTDFTCDVDGSWQSLPASVVDRIARDRPIAIVKFGMGLLRVPEATALPIPILSFHHGNPRAFRGRPAGFYELLQGREVLGQVVQILSNRLDAGQVVAFAETKIHAHSYRATMLDAYAASPLILRQAIVAAFEGRSLDFAPEGKVYRLPSTITVLRLAARLGAAKARRLAYGALFEKEWQVAEAPLQRNGRPLNGRLPLAKPWRTLERPRGYRFLADPFPHPSGGLLVEALRSSTGLGEILHISNGSRRVLLDGRHYSYPAWLTEDGASYLVPEVSDWSETRILRLDGDMLQDVGPLDIPGRPRLIDPTPFHWGERTYLFANLLSEGSSILRLWVGDSILQPFVEHPASPIRLSPAGSRMGGSIIDRDGQLTRVGQDFRGEYGHGVLLFRIEILSPTSFRETLIDEIRFDDCSGPHTLNLREDSALFDYYRQRFSMTAGLRRMRARLSRRLA